MFITALEFLLVFAYGYGEYKTSGTIRIGSLVMLFQYIDRFTGTFFGFAWQYEEIFWMNAEYRTASDMIEAHGRLIRNDAPKLSDWNSLAIRDLDFSYEEGNAPVLRDVSLDIRRGERIAFV